MQTVIAELLAGFRHILATRVLLVVVGMGLIALFGGGTITALNIIFVSQRFHASASLYGPLTAVSGLGIVTGAVLASILATKVTPKTLLAGGVFLLGLGYIVYALQVWYAVALVLFFLLSSQWWGGGWFCSAVVSGNPTRDDGAGASCH